MKTFGIGESAVVEKVGDAARTPRAGMEAGIYARDDGVHLRFSTRGDPATCSTGRWSEPWPRWADDVYGTDDDTLPAARSGPWPMRAAPRSPRSSPAPMAPFWQSSPATRRPQAKRASSEASWRWRTAAAGAADADATLTVELGEPGALGRSRVRLSLRAGEAGFEERDVRIHGSGPQRLRRAAFAALDQVRRAIGR